MARNTSSPNRPPPSAQRPVQAAETNRSNHRMDELDAQLAWQHRTCPEPRRRVDAGLLPVR